tara:strand:- start:266 stop:448 length:183 start_codon:yes stop_codon:yes gene_type:complete
MKKVKYLSVSDKISQENNVLTVVSKPTPMGRNSIYQVKCIKVNGDSATFIAEGNLKLELV